MGHPHQCPLRGQNQDKPPVPRRIVFALQVLGNEKSLDSPAEWVSFRPLGVVTAVVWAFGTGFMMFKPIDKRAGLWKYGLGLTFGLKKKKGDTLVL